MKQDILLSDLQEVIWREALCCYDETYAYNLLTFLPKDYENRTPQSVFRSRPKVAELENVLYQVYKISPSPIAKEIWAQPLENLKQSKNAPKSSQRLVNQLSSHSWVERFIARHTIVYLGGETILPLIASLSHQSEGLPETVHWLLENIAIETSKELSKHSSRLLCPYCIVRCDKNKIKLTWNRSLFFYGCQVCYQSRKFIERPYPIIAVLDKQTNSRQIQTAQNNLLCVNWFQRKTLFEFDRVEIIEATDAEVELFAIQVGNDTDKIRKSRYENMVCTVHSKCNLSKNTMRILNSMFGSVELRG